jgi:predicted dehydrogenase
MEYGNGIMGDMCIHMLDMVRWLLDLGWPKSIGSTGGIYVQKKARSNITDTQTATFAYPDFDVVWQHRTWGDPADPEYPWGATIYGERGTLKVSVNKYEFFPLGSRMPTQSGKAVIVDTYPEDKTERDIEIHVAEANRRHQLDFLQAIATRGKPVADIEQGYISTACCIMANLSQRLGRTLTWDAAKQEVVSDREANARLQRPYREPWVHPEA